jgi:hypothetical protein
VVLLQGPGHDPGVVLLQGPGHDPGVVLLQGPAHRPGFLLIVLSVHGFLAFPGWRLAVPAAKSRSGQGQPIRLPVGNDRLW